MDDSSLFLYIFLIKLLRYAIFLSVHNPPQSNLDHLTEKIEFILLSFLKKKKFRLLFLNINIK